MEEFLIEPDQDDPSDYSSSDNEPQPLLHLSSFAKKIPVNVCSEALVSKTSTVNSQPSSVSPADSSSAIPVPSTTVIVCADENNVACASSASDDEMLPSVTDNPKKRKRNPSKRQKEKEKRLRSHSCGLPCGCTLLKCFETITEEERIGLIFKFNSDFDNVNDQNAYLATMISVLPKERVRTKVPSKRVFSYEYSIPVVRSGSITRVKVCHKAFLSIFGITNRRSQTLKLSLATTG